MKTNRKPLGERIDDFEPTHGRPSQYPWEDWFDGSTWRITRGDHFDIEPGSMSAVIRRRALQSGGRAVTRVRDGVVEFRFVTEAKQEQAA